MSFLFPSRSGTTPWPKPKPSLLLLSLLLNPFEVTPWEGRGYNYIGPCDWFTAVLHVLLLLAIFQRTTLKAATAAHRDQPLSRVFDYTKILFINVFRTATMKTLSCFSLCLPLFAVCLVFGAFSTASGKLLLCQRVVPWHTVSWDHCSMLVDSLINIGIQCTFCKNNNNNNNYYIYSRPSERI